MSKWDLTGFYPSVPVIKPSASVAICDMIGYFREVHLNLCSSVVEVAKCYAQDDGAQTTNTFAFIRNYV